MRKLSKKLGIEAASLYNHIADKSELFELMQDYLLKQVIPAMSSMTMLEDGYLNLHQVVSKHPSNDYQGWFEFGLSALIQGFEYKLPERNHDKHR